MSQATLTFDHLTIAPHYLDHLDDVGKQDIGFDFLEFIKNQFTIDIFSIFITNYNSELYSDVMYICRCDRNKIELYERNKHSENNIVYDFHDQCISLNSKKMDDLYLSCFKSRLTEIITDLKQQRCTLYEERIID